MAIVGAGICGIGAAIELRRAGITDVVLLEKGEELGGTWRDNTYPGCACDIPSVLYSYGFAPNPDWTRVFAEREEIQAYVLRIAREHGIEPLVELRTEVREARWQEAEQQWVIGTSGGRLLAGALILAAGPLHEPVLPDVEGLSTFAGTAFHSSRWRHDHDLRGERVAVIGTGASAAQFVPHIQPQVGKLTVFQRTPPWVMPKLDWRIGLVQRRLVKRLPILQRIARHAVWGGIDAMILMTHRARLARLAQPVARWNIRRGVKDGRLRRLLTPDYTIGCKRVLISSAYYPALAAPNVELVPWAVREIRPHAVLDAQGVEHPVDTIIFGTGFHVTDLPISDRVRGRDGRTMAEVWEGSPRAYLGTSVSGFPNAFTLFGPNIGTGSAFVMLEAQLRYVVSTLTTMRARGWSSVDVRPEAQAAFKADVDRRLARSAWNAGGCQSYSPRREGQQRIGLARDDAAHAAGPRALRRGGLRDPRWRAGSALTAPQRGTRPSKIRSVSSRGGRLAVDRRAAEQLAQPVHEAHAEHHHRDEVGVVDAVLRERAGDLGRLRDRVDRRCEMVAVEAGAAVGEEHDAEQRRDLRHRRQQPADHVGHERALHQRPVDVGRGLAGLGDQSLERRLERLGDRRLEDVLLGVEVAVEQRDVHVGRVADVADGRATEAGAHEHRSRGCEQLLAAGIRAHAAPRRGGGRLAAAPRFLLATRAHARQANDEGGGLSAMGSRAVRSAHGSRRGREGTG